MPGEHFRYRSLKSSQVFWACRAALAARLGDRFLQRAALVHRCRGDNAELVRAGVNAGKLTTSHLNFCHWFLLTHEEECSPGLLPGFNSLFYHDVLCTSSQQP